MPGGKIYTFGIFHEKNQIGFQCFASYQPTKKGYKPIYHFNRTVIHPDYTGLGIGIKFINLTTEYLKNKYNYKIMGKFSSVPVFKAMIKQTNWRFLGEKIQLGKLQTGRNLMRQKGFREYGIKTFHFEYIG